MGASNEEFKNHVAIHRGLSFASPDEVNLNTLGVHWTQDHLVAGRFARTDEPGENGVIIHGLVSPEHIVTENSPDWENYKGQRGITYNEDYEGENETTIRENAPITITGYTVTDHLGRPVQTVAHSPYKKAKA